MPDIGPLELGIVAVIILLLFGPGKADDLGSSLGKSIREFRKATREEPEAPPQQQIAISAPDASLAASTNGVEPAPSEPSPTPQAHYCTACGAPTSERQKFCVSCGTAVTSWI